jgi:hypothetical protein
MNAIEYTYREPVGALATLLAHLRENAGALGVGRARMAVWAASGNMPTAFYLLMTQPMTTFRAAALLCGYVLDVPAAAEQFGIGVPARGRSIEELPPGLRCSWCAQARRRWSTGRALRTRSISSRLRAYFGTVPVCHWRDPITMSRAQ